MQDSTQETGPKLPGLDDLPERDRNDQRNTAYFGKVSSMGLSYFTDFRIYPMLSEYSLDWQHYFHGFELFH